MAHCVRANARSVSQKGRVLRGESHRGRLAAKSAEITSQNSFSITASQKPFVTASGTRAKITRKCRRSTPRGDSRGWYKPFDFHRGRSAPYNLLLRDFANVSNATASTMITPITICWM